MDKDKIIAFLNIMSDKLDNIVDDIVENGCSFKAIEEINLLIGDALIIKGVIKNTCIENSK